VKRHVTPIALIALAACSAPAPVADPVETAAAPVKAEVRPVLPQAAVLGASGFASVEQAPPSPFPETLPPPENRPKDERGFYAQMAGISDAEAAKRMAEQAASRPEFNRLTRLMREREPDNFTGARVVHKPNWAYVLYFKREPEATLAKYTKNPHIKAALARYSRAELDAIGRPWVERFTAHRLLGGHGTDATYGEIRMDMVVSEAEFRAIAAREGWPRLPDGIRLEFSSPAEGAAVDERVRPLVKIFPQSDRALGATNQALLGGRIVLRDGCFFVTGGTGPARLAYFAREVALGLDDQGYLALKRRGAAPRHLGRIGEQFSWGGPIGITETAPMVAELRARCGNAPLEHVGVPESARLFHIRPWVIDAIAERRKISREEAWRRFKACLEDREARKPGAMLDCDML
jgi:hypothetical protein